MSIEPHDDREDRGAEVQPRPDPEVVDAELIPDQQTGEVELYREPVVEPVVDPVDDPVGEDRPGIEPVVDVPGEVVDQAVESAVEVDEPEGDRVSEVDPVSARIAELVSAARTEGRPVGRRTVARELGVTEYRAGQLLARTDNGDGRHTR